MIDRDDAVSLQARIRAHKLYATQDISQWMQAFLQGRQPHTICDLGCGTGQHLGFYLAAVPGYGMVYGLDKNRTLLAEAHQRFPEEPRLTLLTGSMDERLPFHDATCAFCFSNFAIYNVQDTPHILREIRRVLTSIGVMVLIGPAPGNGQELREFSRRLTGEDLHPTTDQLTSRLAYDFLPQASGFFETVTWQKFSSQLVFPSREEFLAYAAATYSYAESLERYTFTPAQLCAACPDPLVVSKEALIIVASGRRVEGQRS